MYTERIFFFVFNANILFLFRSAGRRSLLARDTRATCGYFFDFGRSFQVRAELSPAILVALQLYTIKRRKQQVRPGVRVSRSNGPAVAAGNPGSGKSGPGKNGNFPEYLIRAVSSGLTRNGRPFRKFPAEEYLIRG